MTRLNTIVPEELPGPSPHDTVHHASISRVFKRAQRLWDQVEISQRGQYSDERTHALNKYCQSVSFARVLSICVLTPCPALLWAALMECIPLQNPDDGWKANYGSWMRLWSFLLVAGLCMLFQIRSDTLELSILRMFHIAFGTACGSLSALVLMAATWRFSLLFSIAFASFPFQVFFVTLFLATIRAQGGSTRLNASVKHKLYHIVAPSAISFVYFAFSIAFSTCTPAQQLGMLLLLPVMKILSKNVVANITSDNEETIPAVVVFTVDVFNGLYTSICIQSRSWWTSLLMTALSLGHALHFVWEVNRSTRELERLQSHQANEYPQAAVASSKSQYRSSASLLGSLRLPARVAPAEELQDVEGASTHHSRKMLFRLEYFSLVEYIEGVIPTLYVIYLAILFHLPSAKYHSFPYRGPTANEYW